MLELEIIRMNKILEVTLPVIPVAKGRPRMARTGVVFTPSKTRHYENQLRFFLHKEFAGKDPVKDPLIVHAIFAFVRPKGMSEKKRPFHCVKPDLTNLMKALEDAGNGIIWQDDSQIFEMGLIKTYDNKSWIKITVMAYHPSLSDAKT
jgi:Holliday junction resolvase RusA-like endonuclease